MVAIITPISYSTITLETAALIDAFEVGEVDGDAFPHESHVRVAWGLAQRYGPEEGLRRMSTGIRLMAARAGRPGVYHETITRAWFELIAQAPDLTGAPELFDKRLLGEFYSPERLAAGRERWLEPDLQPLGLPTGGPRANGPSLAALRDG
jgi:hypothetical protein